MLRNISKVTPYFIKYKLEDEEDIYIAYFDTKEELFYNASEMIAFSDIEPVEILQISYEGKDCIYAGWKPGMRFVFKSSKKLGDITVNNVVWDSSYPHWDH